MVLQVQIKKKLGEFQLDVSFEMEQEVFAILGASGCGKSMTLKCIAGIETPDEGRIVLNNRVLYDSQKKINLPPQKRKVGYMFSDYALFPSMTVEKNIMAGMGKKPDIKLVQRYIQQFCLTGLEKHYPAQLSGGQKQRVAMARMIASEPDLLLLDEPVFSALDTYLKWEMEQEMRDVLAKVGKPVLFVSHNRDEVYRMCHKVSCINNGRMEVVEPVKEFFHNPKTRAAAILSGCKNISTAEVIDETHVKAVGWNIILTIPYQSEAGRIKSVGIRAHNFHKDREEAKKNISSENRLQGNVVQKNIEQENIAQESMIEENVFQIKEYRILEDPFEWNISFSRR